MSSAEDWISVLHRLDRAAWSLAAVAAAVRTGEPSAAAVLAGLGLSVPDDPEQAAQVAAMATAPLLQAARFVTGGSTWGEQDDEALLAQGRSSAGAGIFFPQMVLTQLPGLDDGPLRFLDVGVGVAGMAVALCQAMPGLSVVGLDVLDRPLELARAAVAEAGLGDRIELRKLSVADLDDADAFDLAWLPAPFIPRPALEEGLRRVARALRPGGWVLLGHGRLEGDGPDVAITRFKTVAYGGTPLTDAEARAALEEAGLVDAFDLTVPPGAPALTAARRAPS